MNTLSRENSRRSDFKKGIDAMDGRRRRCETSISIRKNKKEEGLAKRRNMNMAVPSLPAMPGATNDGSTASTGASALDSQKVYTAADIPSLQARLMQPNIDDTNLLDVVRAFRKLLSVEHNPPVNEVLASGLLPAFVQMLQLNEKPKVQFEAAWVLTNIASSDKTKAVVDAGAVPSFVQLLSSPVPEVREQVAWCLGNIAGDSPALRDVVLSSGAMAPLLKNIVQPDNRSLYDNCVWTCSNFCRGKNPRPNLAQVAPAIPVLAQVLRGDSDAARTDALWALSYVSDGDDADIQAVLDAGVIDAVVDLLDREESGLVTPALRTAGNVATGSDVQTQAVLDAGLLDRMLVLLSHPRRAIRKEACWVLSNITAGTKEQIGRVLRTRGCMQRVTEMAATSEWDVRKEAVWAVSNVASGGTDAQIMSAIEAGAIDAVCSILCMNDTKMLIVALEAVECILKVGEKHNRDYASLVDECDGIDMIENLQSHESEDVYEKAVSLIETYFGAEDEIDDENIAPESKGDTFSFGVKNLGDEEVCPAGSGHAQPFTTYNFAS